MCGYRADLWERFAVKLSASLVPATFFPTFLPVTSFKFLGNVVLNARAAMIIIHLVTSESWQGVWFPFKVEPAAQKG